jgi:FkbM family methyltransferase
MFDYKFFLFFLWSFIGLQAQGNLAKFEGFFGEPTDRISNLTGNVWYFLPYNPVIIEVGGYEGQNIAQVASFYPDGRIIVFEPNPRAFSVLKKNIQDFKFVTAVNAALNSYNGTAQLNVCHGIYRDDVSFDKWSSLLEDHQNYFRGFTVEVPCVVLDDWCKENQIDHIDLLHLDTEGFELQILKSSPEILKTVVVVHTKTNLASFRQETTQYLELRQFLEQSGFELFSHWYLEGGQGEATFIQKRIFDAIFR